jgi:hypothetical protein
MFSGLLGRREQQVCKGFYRDERRRPVDIVVVGWTPHVIRMSTIYMYKYAMQKYFYETMKYEKMNDGIFFIFLPPQ